MIISLWTLCLFSFYSSFQVILMQEQLSKNRIIIDIDKKGWWDVWLLSFLKHLPSAFFPQWFIKCPTLVVWSKKLKLVDSLTSSSWIRARVAEWNLIARFRKLNSIIGEQKRPNSLNHKWHKLDTTLFHPFSCTRNKSRQIKMEIDLASGCSELLP